MGRHKKRFCIVARLVALVLLHEVKAIQFDQSGEPLDVLALRDIPMPVAGSNDVIVQVALSPIHPADALFVRGIYRIQPTFPQTAGLEGMGRVVAGGHAGISSGMRVAFRWPGAWAEYARVPCDRLTPVPASLSDEDASQFELNVLTALALLEKAAASPNETIIVTAATSVVAHLIAQFARINGITTIGIVRGPLTIDGTRTCCDHVVSLSDPQLAEHVRDLTPSGVVALLDAVGGDLATTLLGTLRAEGRVISYGLLATEAVTVHNATLIYRNLTWYGFGIEIWERALSIERKMDLMQYACDAIARGDVRLPAGRTFALSDVNDAIRFRDQAARVGKAFLRP